MTSRGPYRRHSAPFNAVVHNGILDPGTNFLKKPYMLTQLAQKIREVLDRDRGDKDEV